MKKRSLSFTYPAFADMTLTFTFGIALFCLFTNMIPFIQWGLIDVLKSKTRYANTTRISFLVFFALYIFFIFGIKSFTENSSFCKAIKRFCLDNAASLTFILTICYFASTFAVSVARHLALQTRAFDLGIFSQAIWNTLNGDFLFSSIKKNICLFGDHFQPLQLIALPIYKLWPSPLSLLALQSVSMALCIPLIYVYAKRITAQKSVAVVFAITFFLFLPSRGVLHEDYHPEALAEPLFLLAFLFFRKKHIKAMFLTLSLILLAKENMAGILFCVGIYAGIFRKKIGLGVSLMSFSIAYFIMLTRAIIPNLSGEAYLYTGNFTSLLANPLLILGRIFSGDTVSYVGKLFMPYGFLSFLHLPTLIFCLPILVQNILSENEAMRSFNYHYTIGLTPFVVISAIHGWTVLKEKNKWVREKGSMVLLFSILVLSILRSGPSEYYYFYNSLKEINTHTKAVRQEMSQIPSKYSVLTHNNLIPQSINRKYIYQFDYNQTPTKIDQIQFYQPDYVITDEKFWEAGTADPSEIYANLRPMGYQLDYHKDSFRIYKKTNVSGE